MRAIFATVLLFVAAQLAAAEPRLPERLMLSLGQYVGSGARPLGLGGTYTGIADDYSSVWWNPAGLVQVKRIELQASLHRNAFSNETRYFGGTRDGSTDAIRLNNVGMVFPVPVYQGALSFAFGYNQVMDFDRRTRTRTGQPDSSLYLDYDELESGRLGFWTLAGAMDVSQNVALGVGVNYWTGTDEYQFTGTVNPRGDYVEQSINTDVSGWGASVGALFRVGRTLRLGTVIQTPVRLSLSEDYADTAGSWWDYTMIYPAVFRFGASFCPGRWLLASDVEYRDWKSLQFRSDPPFGGISRGAANQQIRNDYRSTTRISFGGEYLFPVLGLRLRAGYSLEPTNYQPADSSADFPSRNNFSAGIGILLDRDVMLDAGFEYSSFTEKPYPQVSRDISLTGAMVTLSYRM